jgi:hypothetical protein
MITYLGKEWLEVCKDNLNNSEKHREKAKLLNGVVCFRAWDGPDGKDRYLEWEMKDGQCLNVAFECQPAPWKELRERPLEDRILARISCPFEMIAALNRDEISPFRALNSPDYNIDGDRVELITRLQAVNSWNNHNRDIECNYDFAKTDEEGNAMD